MRLQRTRGAASAFVRGAGRMSPTVFREGAFRGFVFSREERQMHIHIQSPQGEAKFWLEPGIELAENIGFSERELGRIRKLIERHEHEIRETWNRHFSGRG